MDPITAAIVAALSAGASFVVKQIGGDVVKDAYGALKGWLAAHHPGVSVDALETQPESKARQDVVAEDLERTGASSDEEVLKLAKALAQQIKAQPADEARSIGVDIGQLDRTTAVFDNVSSRAGATGVHIERASDSNLHFGSVNAGQAPDSEKKA